MAETQKVRIKKSSESIVQPRNAARNTCRCALVSLRKLWTTDEKWPENDEDIAGSIADAILQTLLTPRCQQPRRIILP